MLQILFKIIKNSKYSLCGILGSFMIFVFASLFPHLALLRDFINIGFVDFLKLAFRLVWNSYYTFGKAGVVYLIVICVLFGLNLSVYFYFFDIKKRVSSAGVGFVGAMAGILGVGCASCGAVIISGVLSVLGLGAVISYLPYGGQEFAWLGLILLSISLYLVLKKLSDPEICPVA